MQNRIFLTFACPLKWDDLADIDGEVSRRQCEKCQCSVQKVDESSFDQYEAMRSAEPNKRHCIAVEEKRPFVSLMELMKAHFLSSFTPQARRTNRSVAIAFSAFLVAGNLFIALPVEAKGGFSKDLSSYILDKDYHSPGRIGEGPSFNVIDTDAHNLVNKLRLRRMQPENADIWNSPQANQFIDDFDFGFLSKGHILEFANFLKDKGQFLIAGSLYQLYLKFDPEFKSPIKDVDLVREAFTDKPAPPARQSGPPTPVPTSK